MDYDLILKKLDRIEKFVVGLKEILNVEELSEYTGFTKSTIYKLVHQSLIPYSKPNGKVLFFERKKIDLWLLQNSYKSLFEIKEDAVNYTDKLSQTYNILNSQR